MSATATERTSQDYHREIARLGDKLAIARAAFDAAALEEDAEARQRLRAEIKALEEQREDMQAMWRGAFARDATDRRDDRRQRIAAARVSTDEVLVKATAIGRQLASHVTALREEFGTLEKVLDELRGVTYPVLLTREEHDLGAYLSSFSAEYHELRDLVYHGLPYAPGADELMAHRAERINVLVNRGLDKAEKDVG